MSRVWRTPSWMAVYLIGYITFLYLPILLIPLFPFNAAVQASFPLRGLTLD